MEPKGESMSKTVAMWIICAFVGTIATTQFQRSSVQDEVLKMLNKVVETQGRMDERQKSMQIEQQDAKIERREMREDIKENSRPRKTSINRGGSIAP